MHVLTIPGMKQFVSHIAIAMRDPVMFWGPPGVGKSQGILQFEHESIACPDWLLAIDPTLADRWTGKAIVVDIRLSQYDSVDLRGIPAPTDEQTTVWYVPSTLPFVTAPDWQDDVLIILFLDEINAAAPAVAAVAYQLVNDRAVGEHKLRPNVVIVAAGNREGDKGVTNRMPAPLANRFTHAEVDVDVDAWCYWAQQRGLDPMGLAFIQFRKELLNVFKPEQAIKDKAFATPRSWEKALRYYSANMPEDTKRAAIQGAVGEGPANEFWGFVDVCKDLPSIESIIRDPMGIKLPDQAAIRYAVTVAVSGAMTRETITPLVAYISRFDPEFGVLAWSLAMRRDSNLTSTQEFLKFAKDNRDLLSI